MTKQELRQHIRKLKAGYPEEQLALMSAEICSRLLQHQQVLSARTVLAYHPLPDEVDIRPVLAALLAEGKQVLLPQVLSETEMQLRQYSVPSENSESTPSLARGAYGILEPTGAVFTDYSQIDLALIPGVAFDSHSNRLGRGKGYYDRFLSALNPQPLGISTPRYPYLLGIAFPFQKIASVPCDKNDVRMDEII